MSNNRGKKRGSRAVTVDYKREDIFKFLNQEYPEIDIPSYQHGRILNHFNSAISKAIMQEAYEFLMPDKIGNLRILKYKPVIKIREDGSLDTSNMSVDWHKTNTLWDENSEAKKNKQLVYFTNEHSEGYQYKWYFTNYRSNCVNKTAYCFIPSRSNKRELGRLIKSEEFTGDFYM